MRRKGFAVVPVLMMVVGITLLAGVAFSVVYGADGQAASKPSVWQWISGVFAFLTTGAGGIIFKNLRLIRDLREAILASTQAISALSVFTREVPGMIRNDPEYKAMLEKVDKALEEIADVLAYTTKYKGEAARLRSLISASQYSGKDPAHAKLIMERAEPLVKSFNEALADLKKNTYNNKV